MMDSFRQSLIDYVLSGHAYLHAHTPEKTRFVQELKEVAAELPPDGRPFFVWSPAVRLAGRRGQAGQDGVRRRARAAQSRRPHRSRSSSCRRKRSSC
jgi:hypothetical protein